MFVGVEGWIVRALWLPLANGRAWSALAEASKKKPETRDVRERSLATGFPRCTTHQVIEGAPSLQLARCWKANCAHGKPRKVVVEKAFGGVHRIWQPPAVPEELHSFYNSV